MGFTRGHEGSGQEFQTPRARVRAVVLGRPHDAALGHAEKVREHRQGVQQKPATEYVRAIDLRDAPGEIRHLHGNVEPEDATQRRGKASVAAAKNARSEFPSPLTPPGGGAGAGDDSYRKVFDSYVAAKQNAGEATAKLNYNNFKNALEKQADQLRTKRGIQNVNFGVSVKDGKVSVVARKKKS